MGHGVGAGPDCCCAYPLSHRPAGTGAWLIARDDIDPPQLHALYGFSAIVAVGILYSYRTSSFMKGKKYLLYSVGSLFIMGLGLRELLALS